ncbi:hypothetical protein FD755_013001 [Muntiacus reevesi]|uniref:Armadillo like helical domain containing 4 n=1 Tax=Muntiacus reevesi TaxID=9886 RepID=A0A5N3XL38_MUNRE|nr:hypothetical protein FD755_013001 [Muntiacus reevesi]
MNKQQSEAPSPWRPRQRREPPPPQGPPRGCRARTQPLSSARCSAEASQDSITGIVNSTNLRAHFSSTMSRPIVLHIYLAFCSLLLLNFAIQCLAFPNVERREMVLLHAEKGHSERLNADDLENDSVTSTYTPVSGDPMIVLAGSSTMSLNKVFPSNKETPPVGAGLTQADGSNIYTATEPEVPAREVFGSSQPERMSPQSQPSKATLTNPVMPTASLNIDEREESSRGTIIQPTVEGTTEAIQGFLSYVDDQLFATESPEGLSLGHSPLSPVNTKEMLTTSPRTEKFEANPEHKTTSFPGSKLTAGTESSQMTADNTQATAATEPRLPPSESILSVDPEADSLLGTPAVTMSVSTAVAAAPVVSDEWDDTKLDSASQIKTPELGDSPETQARLEISQTTQAADVSLEGMEGGEALTEAADVGLKLPEMETHMETTLPMARGGERASDRSSFTPTSPMGDPKVSVMNLVQDAADFVESTKENSAVFLETTVSISENESEVHQPLGNRFKEGEDDEDEEDEEEEDEEEEDEEEDEEDKDADSLDKTLGDTELPGFTLPGITSQEPGLEQENVVSLEGVTFQVPDAIQWEQQNQGLEPLLCSFVRCWKQKKTRQGFHLSFMKTVLVIVRLNRKIYTLSDSSGSRL